MPGLKPRPLLQLWPQNFSAHVWVEVREGRKRGASSSFWGCGGYNRPGKALLTLQVSGEWDL